jgi:hypothetical protein
MLPMTPHSLPRRRRHGERALKVDRTCRAGAACVRERRPYWSNGDSSRRPLSYELGGVKMDQKQSVAVEIALQTHVLRTCPEHRELFLDDESDPASAFALAVELVRQRRPYVWRL